MVVAPNLGKVERQVVGEEPVLEPHLLERDLMVGFRQFLQIVHTLWDRVVAVLGQAAFQKVGAEQDTAT